MLIAMVIWTSFTEAWMICVRSLSTVNFIDGGSER
jgi:hypothetical protein